MMMVRLVICSVFYDIVLLHMTGVLDYSDYGPGRDPFRSLTEKKLKETVGVGTVIISMIYDIVTLHKRSLCVDCSIQ